MAIDPVTVVKGIAKSSVLKPGDDGVLSDARGVPFTQDNRQAHESENVPVGVDATPKREAGAALDIDSDAMPDDGVVEVFDDDEDLLGRDEEADR